MKGVLKYCSLGYPGGGRGLDKHINVKRRSISHYKSLLRGKTFVVAPIYKELMEKDASIDIFERMTFEQARMIK